nr:hypothetical protein Iba_chr02cCG10350 [Ipomoea batatas]
MRKYLAMSNTEYILGGPGRGFPTGCLVPAFDEMQALGFNAQMLCERLSIGKINERLVWEREGYIAIICPAAELAQIKKLLAGKRTITSIRMRINLLLPVAVAGSTATLMLMVDGVDGSLSLLATAAVLLVDVVEENLMPENMVVAKEILVNTQPPQE